MDKVNLHTIRESFGRVVYSHKTHEKEAEIQLDYAKKVKWVNIVLTSFTAGSLIGDIFTGQNLIYISSFFATLTLAFTIFQLSFNPDDKAHKHRETGNALWLVREKYICLITDIINLSIGRKEIISRRNQLVKELDVIYRVAPDTSCEAYEQARKALRLEEEFTFNDKEINQFLPKTLHINDDRNRKNHAKK